MQEVTRIEETEVYEPPVLAEAGDYAEETQGFNGHWFDGNIGFRPLG